MSFNNVFKPGLVRVQTAVGPVTFDVKTHKSFNIDRAIEKEMIHGAGELMPSWIGTRRQRPVARGTTLDVRNLLNTLIATGIPKGFEITATGSQSPTDLYLLKWAPVGGIATGSVHKKITVNKGIISLGTLQWSEENPATLDWLVTAIYDAVNNPLAIANNVAAPTGPIVNACEYGGPVLVDGTRIDGLVGGSMDFGMQVITLGDEGKSKPTFAALALVVTEIRLRTRGASNFDGFGDEGVNIATSWDFYLTQGTLGGSRTPIATAQHIKLTGPGGQIVSGPASGGEIEEGMQELMIHPRYNGTAFVTYSAANALP